MSNDIEAASDARGRRLIFVMAVTASHFRFRQYLCEMVPPSADWILLHNLLTPWPRLLPASRVFSNQTPSASQ